MRRYLPVLLLVLCGCAGTADRLSVHHTPLETLPAQPTFEWASGSDTNATYDVVVYEVVWLDHIWIPGRRVCYVTGLTHSTYTMTQTLKPGDYCWGARMRVGDRVWPWITQPEDITELGIMPSHRSASFIRFRVGG